MRCNAPSAPCGRRTFLKLSGLAALGACFEPIAEAGEPGLARPDPTHVLHIRDARIQLAPGREITTTTYDGQFPGPLLRAVVGQPVRADVYNETDHAQGINWHGQVAAVNYAADEGATSVPARSVGRMEFTPTRPGLFFYHSNAIAAAHLDAGLYSAQAGALLVEPAPSRARSIQRVGREQLVVLKDCEPFIKRTQRGCEVGYRSFTINGRLAEYADFEPANTGGSVLVNVLNASATQTYDLALQGHSFEVIALDGGPLPVTVRVPTIQLSPGERVSARVELRQPSGWIVHDPGSAAWDYTRFSTGARPSKPDETFEVVLTRHEAARSGFNRWSINGQSYSASNPRPLFVLQQGLRYRLKIRNDSDELTPLHLQNHQLEITQVAGRPTGGIVKDVVGIGAAESLEVDFVANHRGPALLYCTRQLHRDFGLMALIDYT